MIASEPRFYVTGGTLPPDAVSYVERQADRDLLKALRAAEYCYVLNSRQMGKSSLCVRAISRLCEEGTRTVFLDLTKFGGRNLTAEQWYAALLAELGRELGLRAECLSYWKEHPELPPVQRLFGAITEVALPRLDDRPPTTDHRPPTEDTPGADEAQTAPPAVVGGRSSVVIFVDEIDVTRSLPFNTDEFFAAIRQCYVGRATEPLLKQVTFCLLGTATPAELIEDTRISPFNIGRRIEVRDFTPEEAAPLAAGLIHHGDTETQRKAATEGKGAGEALLARVLYWTGGHPYLTQRLCRAVAEEVSTPTPKTQRLTPSLVDGLCEELFLTHTAKEGDDNLALVRNRLLKSEVELASLLELYGKLRAGKGVADDETNALCGVLKLSGVAKVEAGRLAVRNRIYERVFDRDWVAQHMPDAEVRRQRAAFQRGLVRAAAISAIIMAALSFLTFRAVRSERRANRAELHERQQRLTTERLLYAADMSVAHHDSEKANLGRTMELLNAHRPGPDGEDPRGFEWFYLWRLCHGDLFTLVGRSAPVGTVAFSPDGKRLATGSGDGTVKLWDATTGQEERTLLGHRDRVRHARFSPDGRMLTTLSTDGTARFWDLKAGRATRALSVGPLVGDVAFSPMALSPDGNTLGTRNEINTVTLRDLRTGRAIRTLNTGPSTAGVFSPDGTSLAIGYDGKAGVVAVSLWEVRTGRQIRVFRGLNRSIIRSLAFSPDGRRLAAGSYDGVARVWDVAMGREMRALLGHGLAVNAMAFSPDGRRLATGSKDGTAKIWDVASGRETRWFRGHSAVLMSVAFSPNGNMLATAGGTVKVWDAVRPQETPSLKGRAAASGGSIAFSPDGKVLATGGRDNTVTFWDVATRREVRMLKGDATWSVGTGFSPNGKMRARTRGDGTVTLRDVATGRAERTLRGHTDRVSGVVFSPDGKTLATGSADGTVTLWGVATGRKRWARGNYRDGVLSIAFSPDGGTLAIGRGPVRDSVERQSTIQLLDPATGRTTRSLVGHTGGVSSLAFSSDGQMLAAGSWDSSVTLWDLATGQRIRTLKHPSLVVSVAFSPDGRRLATGSADGAVRLWDVATGREMLTLGELTLDTRVAFSPDGRRLAAGSMGGEVMLWEAATREEVATREARERGAAAPPAR